MKKKIIGGFAILVVAAVAALNVSFNDTKSDLSAISLANVEALAGESWLTNWWDSKVYKCNLEQCSYTYSLGFYSATYYGRYNNCVSGSSYAHCWECESGCDAY